jgi:hypothetical protein
VLPLARLFAVPVQVVVEAVAGPDPGTLTSVRRSRPISLAPPPCAGSTDALRGHRPDRRCVLAELTLPSADGSLAAAPALLIPASGPRVTVEDDPHAAGPQSTYLVVKSPSSGGAHGMFLTVPLLRPPRKRSE